MKKILYTFLILILASTMILTSCNKPSGTSSDSEDSTASNNESITSSDSETSSPSETNNEISDETSNSDDSSNADETSGESSLPGSTPGNTPTSGSAPTSGTNPTAGATPTTGAGTTFKPPVYNMNGAKIRVLVNPAFKTSPGYSIIEQGFENAEEVYNVTFEITEFTDEIAAYNQFVSSYLSGNPNCEMFYMRGYDITPRYASTGIILNMSEYYDFDKDLAWQNAYVKNSGVFRGDRYGLNYGETTPGYAIWYNKALFRAANVPDPWTFVDNNTWNWKTFRDVAKKLTRDTNGDGKTDIWAFSAEDPIGSLIVTNGGKLIDISTKPAKFAADSPQAIEAIEYYKLLRGVDKVIPDATSGLDSNVFFHMQTGKVAMFPYGAAFGPYLVKNGIKASDLGWVHWPKGNSAQNKDYVIPTITAPRAWVIPSNVKKPKEIVAIAAYATAFWSPYLKNPVDITEISKLILVDDEYLDVLVGNNRKLFLEGASHNVQTNMLNYIGSRGVLFEMLNKIGNNELTTATALATYKNQIQSLIEADESSNPGGIAG